MIAEEWRDIEGLTGFQVSSIGRVRGLDRLITTKRGVVKPYAGRMRKTPLNIRNNYPCVKIEDKSYYVHRLVAKAFVDGYADGLDVNHKDGTRWNNRADNLEWVTRSQNNIHARDVLKISYTPPATGARNHASRAVVATHVETGEQIRFAAIVDACNSGFSRDDIYKCCKGSRVSHKGYRWRYE